MENKKAKQQPSQKIIINIGPNEYEIDFKKITNAQRIDIESMIIRLTSGTSKDMVQGTSSAFDAYMTSQVIATFQILLPQLSKDLNVSSLLELNKIQTKAIVKEYEKYYVWSSEWSEFINDDVEEEEDKKEVKG